jgi:hypothetical protein
MAKFLGMNIPGTERPKSNIVGRETPDVDAEGNKILKDTDLPATEAEIAAMAAAAAEAAPADAGNVDAVPEAPGSEEQAA